MTDGWLPDLSRHSGVKYQAIADAIGSAIERGELGGGDRLPPQRELALRLGVDLTTVTKAYDAARQRGLIEARGRAGSFVREPRSVAADDLGQVDPGMNLPPELPGDLLAHAIADTTAALLLGGSPLRLQYQPAGGASRHRAAGVALLARLGLDADEEQLVIAAGSQNALHAIVHAALAPGDAVACGRFVYPGFKAIAARRGLRLVPLPDFGPDTLRAACASESIKALYVVPTNDNPTTETLSLTQRRAIAQSAEALGLQVIEDDAYGALDPIAPIAAFAPDRCWYVAGTSKILSPALRVAFVRAPGIGAALRLAADIHETAIMPPPLNVALIADWIADGSFDRLLDAMRSEAARRQALAGQWLDGLDVARHPQGYHLWVQLQQGIAAADLAEAMRPSGLSVIAGDRFAVGTQPEQAVRVSLGGPLQTERLTRGLRLLQGYAATPLLPTAALI